MMKRVVGPSLCLLTVLLVCGEAAGDGAEKTERIGRLVRALSHAEFGERERATEQLIASGADALEAISPLLNARDGETLYRARRVFQGIRGFSPEVEARILKLAGALKKEPVPGVEQEVTAIIDGGPAAVAFAADLLKRQSGEFAAHVRDELLVRSSLRDFRAGRGAGDPSALRGIGEQGLRLLARTARDKTVSPPARVYALNALRQVRGAAAKETAFCLLKDPANPVRQLALLHLTELATPAAPMKPITKRPMITSGTMTMMTIWTMNMIRPHLFHASITLSYSSCDTHFRFCRAIVYPLVPPQM